MEEYLLTCSDCDERFFTQGESDFYKSKRLTPPTRCKRCRDKKKLVSNNIFTEISDCWNIEAKNENPAYFYNISEANSLLEGKKHFVIGRKGTGKTAIAEYLSNIDDSQVFSEKLSFKNFPFNYLYSFDNSQYTAPNQYITIWKYLIYSCVCKMMVKNEAIDKGIVTKLEKIYTIDAEKSLERMVKSWTTKSFGVEILGTGISHEKEIKLPDEMTWIEKCDIFEDVILKHLDISKYFIVIDELDEDYREFKVGTEKNTYLQLLTSLFKATQNIRALFRKHNLSVFPVVFLRTDIYSLLKDSDKNKWSAYKVDIDWTEEEIKKMLAHRISVASDSGSLTFEQAWRLLFTNREVTMGNQSRNQMTQFDYITRSTQLRPRDFVHYFIECSNAALDAHADKISSETVKAVDDKFSNYLRDEIVDEVHSIMPDISEIFEILSQIRKQTFSPKEFVDMYKSYVESKRITDCGAENVLRMLFEFSVIGNQPTVHGKAIFKYQTVRARFNYRENIMIHRGLYKTLQIF